MVMQLGWSGIIRLVCWETARSAAGPEGRRLAAVGNDGRINLWDTATGEKLWSAAVGGIGLSVAFSAVAVGRSITTLSESTSPDRFRVLSWFKMPPP